VNTQFWLDRWAQGQIGFHQAKVNPYLQAYWSRLGIEQTATVFVPLCGKSLDMRWLSERGHGVIGIEVSQKAVREFFAENDLAPTVTTRGRFEHWESGRLRLLCGDFFDLEPDDLQSVGAVFDRAALVAMPPELRSRYASKLMQVIPPATPVLLVAMTYAQHEMKGPPFAVDETAVRSLFPDARVELLTSREVLGENPHFRERGLTALTEQSYFVRYN
jgi:thiopurine S-methyltransferase